MTTDHAERLDAADKLARAIELLQRGDDYETLFEADELLRAAGVCTEDLLEHMTRRP